MRGTHRKGTIIRPIGCVLIGTCLAVGGCKDSQESPPPGMVAVPGRADQFKTKAAIRAQRRAYDGAPPVIPHENFGMTCLSCHSKTGTAVGEIGFAPPMPHEATSGLSAVANCKQCHVFQRTQSEFAENAFVGLKQDLRTGARLNDLAPPAIPHPIFMRENCLACHAGPAAREEIRTTHPERTNCRQCHLAVVESSAFSRR